MSVSKREKELLKLLKAQHKEQWDAPLGKRKCSIGCGKVKAEDEFTGGQRRCKDCIAERQRTYHKRRLAEKVKARGGVKLKVGRPKKSTSTKINCQ